MPKAHNTGKKKITMLQVLVIEGKIVMQIVPNVRYKSRSVAYFEPSLRIQRCAEGGRIVAIEHHSLENIVPGVQEQVQYPEL
jgi:hypothetical protein